MTIQLRKSLRKYHNLLYITAAHGHWVLSAGEDDIRRLLYVATKNFFRHHRACFAGSLTSAGWRLKRPLLVGDICHRLVIKPGRLAP